MGRPTSGSSKASLGMRTLDAIKPSNLTNADEPEISLETLTSILSLRAVTQLRERRSEAGLSKEDAQSVQVRGGIATEPFMRRFYFGFESPALSRECGAALRARRRGRFVRH
jgi:hypothetical protein